MNDRLSLKSADLITIFDPEHMNSNLGLEF